MPGAPGVRLSILLPLCALWVALLAPPALAHARLVEAEPAAGEVLAGSPERAELRFSEPVDAEFSPIEVRDSAGERVDNDDARTDPEDARVVAATLEELPPGSYDVRWRMTSIDGHVVEGRYSFAVAGSEETRGGTAGGTGTAATEQEPSGAGAAREDPAPILAYSVLSLGVVAVVIGGAYLVRRLLRGSRG
jgi:copper resistance protein C